ncbi:hypothetical protein [Martelella mangrovi]|uniref:Uncharacterized protein n=1 Tax=Martelella mangrovi TaxID=1397477 RepID=A0ABV2IAV6_9HYPH|nr:hypothetical protein [uncultured Martelella sp.]
MQTMATNIVFEEHQAFGNEDEKHLLDLIETAVSVAIRLGYSDTAAALFSACESVHVKGAGDMPMPSVSENAHR